MPNSSEALIKTTRNKHKHDGMVSKIWNGGLPPDICHVMNGAQEILEDVFCNLLGILHPGLQ